MELQPIILKSGDQPVLLAVLAHPDDETFGTGGTLALYARRGVKVFLICATRGEVGEVDEEYMQGFNSIADRRVDELRCAVGLLGLTEVIFLDYRDSGMEGSPDNRHPQALTAQPVEEVANKVAEHIQRIRPQVLITFDPIGGYWHPDHIAIHQATVRAFELCRDEKIKTGIKPFIPSKFYFNTFPRGFLKAGVRLIRLFGGDPRHFGRNKDIDLLSIAEVDFPINAKISYLPVAEIRDQASACHASQGGQSMNRGPLGWFRRLFSANETFMRAFPPPDGKRIERDLYEGL
jgi:N-acetyl-1-D-myo-inositol-2-amino-2-deoxy-alpha-D-glucopyranoside deacetylase